MDTRPILTPAEARRLAIEVQRLGRDRLPATADGLLEVVRQIGSLQLESTNPVARNELLVAWSRLGPFDPTLMDRLLWQERTLFEYFAHAASVVPTSDFDIHRVQMRHWATGDSAWDRRVRTWMEANVRLSDAILERLAADGPLRTGAFELVPGPPWQSTAWPIARNVERMLEFLWIEGRILPSGRWRNQRIWQLAERCLPAAIARPALPDASLARTAVERSLRSLGVATARHIDANFTRFRYPGLPSVLRELEADGRIQRAAIGDSASRPWPGEWWIHVDDLPLLERIRAAGDAWTGRLTLLSPLDNLIADRPRTKALFGFEFRAQSPPTRAMRAVTVFPMPILQDDRLIGDVRARFDRSARTLSIQSLRLTSQVPRSAAMARLVRTNFEELATFLDADRLAVDAELPERWRRTMAS